MNTCVYSAMRTPDGTVIRSRDRHDYVTHKDLNGNTYMLDGGTEYIRSSRIGDEEYVLHYLEDPHEVLREVVDWGTRGIDGDEPLRYILIKDMSTEHLLAVLDTQQYMCPKIKQVMINELQLRGVED